MTDEPFLFSWGWRKCENVSTERPPTSIIVMWDAMSQAFIRRRNMIYGSHYQDTHCNITAGLQNGEYVLQRHLRGAEKYTVEKKRDLKPTIKDVSVFNRIP